MVYTSAEDCACANYEISRVCGFNTDDDIAAASQSRPFYTPERERERERGRDAMSKLKYSSTEERLWSTSLSAVVASIPALMIGYTFAFPSSAILDLTEDKADLPEDYRFSHSLADIFAVNHTSTISTLSMSFHIYICLPRP